MTAERIKQIQQETAYPESVSVQQALLKVWNECEQDTTALREQVSKLREGLDEADVIFAHLEDFTHGKEGEVITHQRGKIKQLLNETK